MVSATCASPGCEKVVEQPLACPKCMQMGLPPTYFCSQVCFKANYAHHKSIHSIAKQIIAARCEQKIYRVLHTRTTEIHSLTFSLPSVLLAGHSTESHLRGMASPAMLLNLSQSSCRCPIGPRPTTLLDLCAQLSTVPVVQSLLGSASRTTPIISLEYLIRSSAIGRIITPFACMDPRNSTARLGCDMRARWDVKSWTLPEKLCAPV